MFERMSRYSRQLQLGLIIIVILAVLTLPPGLVQSSIRLATPFVLGSLAALLASRAGVLNLAIEGKMLLGAFVAVIALYKTGYDPFVGVIAASLSGGEMRRCALARVLAPSPDILLLDEPTNHLDLPAIEWLEDELKAMRSALLGSIRDREGAVRQRLLDELNLFAGRLRDDAALRARLDRMAADLTVFMVERYGAEVTTVITHTIERWDGKEAARRIELHVGRDLQFIRINGTIVGGLVGVVIHAVSLLVP